MGWWGISSLFSIRAHYLSRAVRKLLKGFLVAVGVLLALAVVAVLGLNLYVQSSGTQRRIEHALSSGLKAPVHVTSTIITPWTGLKASGITVEQAPPFQGNFLEAASFTAKFDWLGLFKHRLDAQAVTLDQPHVTWFQSPGGRWELPHEAANPQEEEGPAPGTAPAPVATPTPMPLESPAPPAGQPWAVTVHNLAVTGASFDFWDDKGYRVVEFAGVQFACADPRASGAQGQASCTNVSLHDRLFFTGMHTDWSFERGLVKLSNFQTTLGGGQINGNARVNTQSKHTPFTADVKFGGVDVSQLMTQAGGPGDEVTGTMNGWIDLYGNTGKMSTLTGSGHLALDGGQMQNVEILQILGQGLQIPDLVEMNLKTAEVDARVASGVINIDKLDLESQNLELTAHGTVGIDGKLAVQARLYINSTISERMPAFILASFQQGDTAGSHYVDFTVGNTLSHPKTDLLENILGRRIQSQMSDLMKSIFGGKHGAQKLEPEGSPP
jgi:uncharacterized protein involved in outer membrane biogenesis